MKQARLAWGLVALGALLTTAADWPQLLGPTRDGVSTERGLDLTWNRAGPPMVWQKELGEGYSAPVVAGGRLVIFHRAGDEEVVECLDARSGEALWRHAQACSYEDPYGKGNGPRATPVVSGGKVYTLGVAGALTCLDLEQGTRLWRRDLAADYRPRPSFFGVGTSPLVEGKLVVVNIGAAGAGIVALDATSGKEVWKATDDEASYATPVVATLDGQRRLVFFTRAGLVGLDPQTGKVCFQKPWRSRLTASVNAASPLVVDDHIFLTSSYSTGAILLRVSADRLEEVWSNDEVLSCHFNTPVYHQGHLYGVDGRQETGTVLRCVEWKTGKPRWSKEGLGCAAIIRIDGQLLILAEDGSLVVAECTPEAYRERSRASILTGPIRAHPALADGLFYARDDRKLVCLSLRGR